jgi:hypothetical protein
MELCVVSPHQQHRPRLDASPCVVADAGRSDYRTGSGGWGKAGLVNCIQSIMPRNFWKGFYPSPSASMHSTLSHAGLLSSPTGGEADSRQRRAPGEAELVAPPLCPCRKGYAGQVSRVNPWPPLVRKGFRPANALGGWPVIPEVRHCRRATGSERKVVRISQAHYCAVHSILNCGGGPCNAQDL